MTKKDGTPDLRIKRTQKAIKESFFILIEEKGFEHIAVKDITDKAMISRNTFYLHYEDKYDLINKICDDLARKLFFGVGKQLRREQRLCVDVDSVSRILKIGLSIIDEDREAYRILLTSSGAELFTKKIHGIISRALDLIKDDIDGVDGFSVEYVVSGVIGLVKYYVTKENPSENVDFHRFAQLHFGTIIDSINKNKASRG